ncbi:MULTISPECIES: hypothetical protein [unclassified Halobacteriovorax]|uniref:hypothetical protein n=1 Tax=unclassified Halobacteriovorax TaxID=2639665 RepID=UPI00399B5450
MKNSSIIKNSILIFILSFFVSIAVYSQDGIYYGAYKIEYRGKLKEEIKKRAKDFEAKVKEINQNYVSIVSKCHKLKGRDRSKCYFEQRGLFKKKHGGNPIDLERKLKFKEQFISVAPVYKYPNKNEQIADIGVLLRKHSRSSPGKIARRLAIKLTSSSVIAEVPFKYSPFAKDFRNNRIKLFHKDDLWLDVDEAKDLVVLDKSVFKMTKNELDKKYPLVGRLVHCSNGISCDTSCSIKKIENGVITYSGEFSGERDTYSTETIKIKLQEVLYDDGTLHCNVYEGE